MSAFRFPYGPRTAAHATLLDWVGDRPECSPVNFWVARAILRLSRDRGYCAATREQIRDRARVGHHAIIETIAWLERIGAVRVEVDLEARSRRRIVPIPEIVFGERGAP